MPKCSLLATSCFMHASIISNNHKLNYTRLWISLLSTGNVQNYDFKNLTNHSIRKQTTWGPKSGFRSNRHFLNSFQALVRASTLLHRLIRISWINHCPFCITPEFLSSRPLQSFIFCIQISAAPWIVEKSCARLLIANVAWSEVETTFVQARLLRCDLTSTL